MRRCRVRFGCVLCKPVHGLNPDRLFFANQTRTTAKQPKTNKQHQHQQAPMAEPQQQQEEEQEAQTPRFTTPYNFGISRGA
jgi:hypothetical protein